MAIVLPRSFRLGSIKADRYCDWPTKCVVPNHYGQITWREAPVNLNLRPDERQLLQCDYLMVSTVLKSLAVVAINPKCTRTLQLTDILTQLQPNLFPNLRIGDNEFIWGSRTYVMGVVNATPDSFSGDGVLPDPTDIQGAVDQALRMEDEGADIIDIGGESTRPASLYPDAKPVSAGDEIARVVPIIADLTGR